MATYRVSWMVVIDLDKLLNAVHSSLDLHKVDHSSSKCIAPTKVLAPRIFPG